MSIILKTDSYKLNHWNQYPKGTERVYSYFESRGGARFPETVFFGLQYLLKRYMVGDVVMPSDVDEAARISKEHFGTDKYFNREGWDYIANELQGRLPLRIRAVPEGTVVPTGNALMTVENTDDKCYWLTNAMESMLTHVWHPSTVATLSRHTQQMIARYLVQTAESSVGLPFMLHDFGYRGVSSDESAALGGAGHLVNFMGTDTLVAMKLAMHYYNAPLEGLAYSVAATEHSIMTSRGRDGEAHVVADLLDNYPTGILSCVADSYDIYRFVDQYVGIVFKEQILARDGVFVVRPDSVTPDHPTPEGEVLWILKSLWHSFGGETNSKGYKVLDPHVRVLWGDGIDTDGIGKILLAAQDMGFSAENLVFGMGGGLLQKVNRDTQRFAFKSSAQKRNGQWYDVYKEPLDKSKASKRGRLSLLMDGNRFVTGPLQETDDQLVTVFENGELLVDYTFQQIRDNAAVRPAVLTESLA